MRPKGQSRMDSATSPGCGEKPDLEDWIPSLEEAPGAELVALVASEIKLELG